MLAKNVNRVFQQLFFMTVVLFILSYTALAQNNEIGLMLGANTTPDRDVRPISGQTLSKVVVNSGLTFGLSYARRIAGNDLASVHFETVFFATPSKDVSATITAVPRNYAALFVAPGVKIKFLPNAGISPYVAAGGGYARFDESEFQVNNAPNTGQRGTNTGTFNYGGGLEFKVFRFLALRGEVRDFISGNPRLNAIFSSDRQHNVISSAGLVLRF